MNIPHANKIKSQVRKIFWITLCWTIISIFQFFNIYATLHFLDLDVSGLDASLAFRGSILTGCLAGILGGCGVVFLWEKWLRTEPYGWTIISIFLSFSLIYLFVALPVGLYYQSHQMGLPFIHSRVLEVVISHLTSINQLQSYLFWLMVVLATLIYLLVNDKYGPGVFRAFLMGKYFHPKREERIFMFLDLRSSTSIAEKLGEELYFHFLRDVYKHCTSSIIYSKGEIYQYVGDEIVISWPTSKGTQDANCLRCFFDIQNALREQEQYYQKTYNTIPEFKAGLHYGYVMAGEIGVVKRDIAFSGDVLNTAARIQGKCNELGVNILFSKFLLNKLNLDSNTFVPREIGEMLLRGKEQKVVLFTV
ncbi:MAG: adenylate/guanylate cyclase domain-containing protein [Marinifilaceae bacterium]